VFKYIEEIEPRTKKNRLHDKMTTTANKLGEREEKGKQEKETQGKMDWTWICTSNDEKNEIRF
jgi:hypothetical protein